MKQFHKNEIQDRFNILKKKEKKKKRKKSNCKIQRAKDGCGVCINLPCHLIAPYSFKLGD